MRMHKRKKKNRMLFVHPQVRTLKLLTWPNNFEYEFYRLSGDLIEIINILLYQCVKVVSKGSL